MNYSVVVVIATRNLKKILFSYFFNKTGKLMRKFSVLITKYLVSKHFFCVSMLLCVISIHLLVVYYISGVLIGLFVIDTSSKTKTTRWRKTFVLQVFRRNFAKKKDIPRAKKTTKWGLKTCKSRRQN